MGQHRYELVYKVWLEWNRFYRFKRCLYGR